MYLQQDCLFLVVRNHRRRERRRHRRLLGSIIPSTDGFLHTVEMSDLEDGQVREFVEPFRANTPTWAIDLRDNRLTLDGMIIKLTNIINY